MALIRAHILVSAGTESSAFDSDTLVEQFNTLLKKNKLDQDIKVIKTDSFGFDLDGPIVVIYPEGIIYNRVQTADISEIIETHLMGGKRVFRLMAKLTKDTTGYAAEENKIFDKQLRIALRNCGIINPEKIEEYIARDGYRALCTILTDKKDPMAIIEEIKKSGLRGRGGGGFSTGMKWEFAAKVKNDLKYVCCNADEGDPGAFMDRSILEGDPHSIIEAMTIAGYCIGSNYGYAYVRAEYPIAVARLQMAIDQAKEWGLIGDNIVDSGFSFDLEIRLGAGAFVCGEETALMRSIEGKRGNPTPRPPFPAVKGLFGQPTILNNVETYANIPVILNKGADWFSSVGTDRSKGTKVFALGGKINNVGLVEIPMGTTVREIVYDVGGGIPGGKAFKAVQTGGPSGGCLPSSLLDTPIDYDNLVEAGSMMGSGGMIVMDQDTCMVDIAKFFLEFTVDESCGKCAPCRIGTKRMFEILEKITAGDGSKDDVTDLKQIAETLKNGSLCALGQTAANPILSTLMHFREEYDEHVIDKKCRCGVCKGLTQFFIIADLCKKCGLCAKRCPVECISGVLGKEPYVIDTEACIKCGACIDECRFGAVIKK